MSLRGFLFSDFWWCSPSWDRSGARFVSPAPPPRRWKWLSCPAPPPCPQSSPRTRHSRPASTGLPATSPSSVSACLDRTSHSSFTEMTSEKSCRPRNVREFLSEEKFSQISATSAALVGTCQRSNYSLELNYISFDLILEIISQILFWLYNSILYHTIKQCSCQ